MAERLMVGEADAVVLAPPGCGVCGDTGCDVVRSDCTELLHWLPGRFAIVRCRHCGLMRTSPQPTGSEIRAYYPDSYASYAPIEEQPSRRRRDLLKALLRVPYALRYGADVDVPAATPERRRALDVGSGTGHYAARLSAAGWDVSIIEPNGDLAAATAAALGLPPDQVFAGTAEEARFPAAAFDLVTMSHVVEHLHDPVGVLEKARDWLRPGGELRLSVPNARSWEAKAFGRVWHGLDVPRHLYHFEPETLRDLLERCGFVVLRMAPQHQSGSLSSSVLHLGRRMLGMFGRRRPYRRSRVLYCLFLVPGSILVALGNAAYLDVTAGRR